MEIVDIFANRKLLAIKYPGEEKDEFERLFSLWNDIEHLEDFFENNKADLKSGFFGAIEVEEAVLETREEASRLEKKLKFLTKGDDKKETLSNIFKPLNNLEYKQIELSKTKVKGDNFKSWLRIYAIKIEENCYLVTGGAIKLTYEMKDREHTNVELRKLEKVRNFLREQGIFDSEAFEI